MRPQDKGAVAAQRSVLHRKGKAMFGTVCLTISLLLFLGAGCGRKPSPPAAVPDAEAIAALAEDVGQLEKELGQAYTAP